jgi:hypothetical protein
LVDRDVRRAGRGMVGCGQGERHVSAARDLTQAARAQSGDMLTG